MRRIGVFLVAIGLLLGRVAFGATELIANGGFESFSTAPWQVVGNLTGINFVSNQSQAHTGTNFLTMGNVNGPQAQRVFQVVTIPSDTILADYSYFFSDTSTDAVATAQ